LAPFDAADQNSSISDESGKYYMDYILDTINWSNEQLEKYGVVILAKGNARSATDWSPWLTEDVQQAFVDFVERGGGLLVIHSGTVGYRDDPLFRELVGGVFVHHPAPCTVTVNTLPGVVIPEIGVRTFEAYDEHYLMELFGDDHNVFMTSTSAHGTQPAGWTRQQGKGRVCVLTPGHYGPVWQDPDYQYIIDAALAWCAGEN